MTRLAASVWCLKPTEFSHLQTLSRNTTAHAVTVLKPLRAMMEKVEALKVAIARTDEEGFRPLGRLLLGMFGDTAIMVLVEGGLVATMIGKMSHLVISIGVVLKQNGAP